MKVALVHDYLKEFGGAERVLEALHELFPEAPVYTAYLDLNGLASHGPTISTWDIRTSWLQKIPLAGRLISPFRILAPAIFESFDLNEYDLVISSCNIYFSKAVITRPGALHLSYIHTPPRYLYGYATSFNYKKNPITRVLGELMNHLLRLYDFETSQRPDILIANSQNVAQRIKKFYRREAVVIYPPVETEAISRQSLASRKSDYYLSLNRLVKGMGTELIIEAATKLKLSLKVAGIGPELERLKKMAGPTVEFLGFVSDQERTKLFSEAQAFITNTGEVDFGITAVEAQAAGTPVIAPRSGGYLENILEGKTGVYFEPNNLDSLMLVLKKFQPEKFKAQDCRKNASRFSKAKFKQAILKLVASH